MKGCKVWKVHDGFPELLFKDFIIFEDTWIYEAPFIKNLTTNENLEVLEFKYYTCFEWTNPNNVHGRQHVEVKRSAVSLKNKDIDKTHLFTNSSYYFKDNGTLGN